MLCIVGRQDELSEQLMKELGQYRHSVFIDHLGWPLRVHNEIESDEFDGPDAVYVATRNERGAINAIARLLPTTSPYLLEHAFPTLWSNFAFPHSEDMWELSRFAAMDIRIHPSVPQQASSKHTAEFFRCVLEVAADRGARNLITVSPVGIERLLELNGFEWMRGGIYAQAAGD